MSRRSGDCQTGSGGDNGKSRNRASREMRLTGGKEENKKQVAESLEVRSWGGRGDDCVLVHMIVACECSACRAQSGMYLERLWFLRILYNWLFDSTATLS